MTTMIKAFGLCGLNALTTVVIRVRLQWRTREGPKLEWNIAAQGTSKFTVNIGFVEILPSKPYSCLANLTLNQ